MRILKTWITEGRVEVNQITQVQRNLNFVGNHQLEQRRDCNVISDTGVALAAGEPGGT